MAVIESKVQSKLQEKIDKENEDVREKKKSIQEKFSRLNQRVLQDILDETEEDPHKPGGSKNATGPFAQADQGSDISKPSSVSTDSEDSYCDETDSSEGGLY